MANQLSGKFRLTLIILLIIGILPFELNGYYNPRLSTSVFWIVEVATWILLPILIFSIGRRTGVFSLDELGFHSKIRGKRSIGLPIILLIVVPLAMYQIDRWTMASVPRWIPLNYGAVPFNYKLMVPPPGASTGWLRLLALLHFSLTAGFVEEIYYRAMMHELFPKSLVGAVEYILVSTLVFTSVHWEGGVWGMTEAFVFGIVSASIFRATRNIWPLIAAHVLIDFLWLSQG